MPGPMTPGPLTLPAILPDSALSDLGAILRQASTSHGVYNALGRKIGSFDSLDAMCAGKWLLLAGETAPPVSQLYVRDFWGKRTPLSAICVKAARATASGTASRPVTPASAAIAVANTNKSAPAPVSAGLPNLFDFAPGLFLDQAAADQKDQALNVQLGRYALWGALGLLGVSLLTSGRRR